MLASARALGLTLLLTACSLRSTSALTRCESNASASGCGAAGNAGTAGNAGGGASGSGGAGGAATGGTAGDVAQAGAAGAGGQSCSANGDCAPNQVCGELGTCEPGLVVSYADNQKPGDPEDPTASTYLRPDLQIDNLLDESVPLQDLTLRYYYSLEQAAPEAWDCFYDAASSSCSDLDVTFGGTDLQHYFELGFTSGELAFGGNSDHIRIGIYKDGFSKYNQTDDYSYECNTGVFERCDKIALYRKGELVWGKAPY